MDAAKRLSIIHKRLMEEERASSSSSAKKTRTEDIPTMLEVTTVDAPVVLMEEHVGSPAEVREILAIGHSHS